MPRATVSTDVEKFDLRSCPGGYVELKRMTYGQLLERVEMGVKMSVTGTGNSPQADIKSVQRAVTEFEFRTCISGHNLEDDAGAPLNFHMPGVYAVLDPKVGQEISKLIDDMNQFEVESGNSWAAPAPTS